MNERLILSNDEQEEFGGMDNFLSNEPSYGELPGHQQDVRQDHHLALVANDDMVALEEYLRPTAEPGLPKKSGK